MKSFFDKIKPTISEIKEIKFKLKYKIFKEEELKSWLNHKNCFVRAEVARKGYFLNFLVNDPSWWIRDEAKFVLKIRGLS